MKSISSHAFLFAKDNRPIDDVGVAKTTVFQEIWPWAGFKTGDFVKGKLGGGYRGMTPVIRAIGVSHSLQI